MFPRGWNRIQQSRRDSLHTLKHEDRNEVKKETTNLINGILELENKLVNKLDRNFQDVYQPNTHKLDMGQA